MFCTKKKQKADKSFLLTDLLSAYFSAMDCVNLLLTVVPLSKALITTAGHFTFLSFLSAGHESLKKEREKHFELFAFFVFVSFLY